MRRLSRLEWVVLLATVVFLSFTAGWFLRATTIPHTYVTTAHSPSPSDSTAFSDTSNAADGLLEGEQIAINQADLYDLDRLPGIGQVRAQAILDYRAEHGPFQTTDQLLEVSGIGEATLEQILPYITLEE